MRIAIFYILNNLYKSFILDNKGYFTKYYFNKFTIKNYLVFE